LNDVSREDYDDVLADFGKQIVKTVPLARIESCGRLIDDK